MLVYQRVGIFRRGVVATIFGGLYKRGESMAACARALLGDDEAGGSQLLG